MANTKKGSQAEFKLLTAGKTDFNLIFGNFNYVISRALDMFKKDPVNLVMAAAIPLVAAGLIIAVLIPMLLNGLIGVGTSGLIAVAASVILSLIAYVAMYKAVIDISKGGKINVGEVIGFGAAHFSGFFILGIKVLLTIFTGLTKWANAWLSPIYFVENNGKVDEAIKSSQATAAGKTATMVWTIILVGIAVTIVGNILSSVWFNFFWRISFEVAQLGTYIIQGLVTPFIIISHFILRGELEKHGDSTRQASGSTPSHNA